jgi:hypothetical protein
MVFAPVMVNVFGNHQQKIGAVNGFSATLEEGCNITTTASNHTRIRSFNQVL